MYYLVLCISDILFASQFLFNQKFEEHCGSSLLSAMMFSLYTSVFGFLVLFAVNGFKMAFSLTSLIIAAVYAVVSIIYTVASVKSFESVNLSAYSIFAMLGGMLLPSVWGLAFCGEEVTGIKLGCYALIAAALFFTIDFKQKSGKKIYYAAVFVLNGMTGVLSVIHQSGENIVDSFSFLMLARMCAGVLSAVYVAKKSKKAIELTNIKSLFYSFGFSIFCTVGNLLLLISLKHLSASVQYPIVTGGVMLISLIISLLRKENVSRRDFAATAIAAASTVLIAFQG